MAYENDYEEILNLFKIAGKDVPHEDSNTGQAIILMKAICDAHSLTIPNIDQYTDDDGAHIDELIDGSTDFFDAIEELEASMNSDDDFSFEFDGEEYRIIKDASIWDIYRDEIQRIVEDCYIDVINLDKIPGFIAVSIDWEQTAKNAYVDGYGHTFSGYDGSENKSSNGWWIFRTN